MCNFLYDVLSLDIGSSGETVVHVPEHDVQDVDAEFPRDVTHDVARFCHQEDRDWP